MSSEDKKIRMIRPTKGDRLAERLRKFLLDLHDRGLITWINETEEDAEAISVAIYEFAERELGDGAEEVANE